VFRTAKAALASLVVVALASGSLLGACSDGASDGAVPFEFIPVDDPPSVPADSGWQSVSLDIESEPDRVEPGSVLEFVVVISNPSDRDIDVRRSCPAYFMNFGESAEGLGPIRSLLNCDDAENIPARSAERFAMKIDMPAELDLDRGSVYWRLEPGISDTASSEVAVEDGI